MKEEDDSRAITKINYPRENVNLCSREDGVITIYPSSNAWRRCHGIQRREKRFVVDVARRVCDGQRGRYVGVQSTPVTVWDA